MTKEGQNIDRKSLKMFTGKNVRWGELAKDCVCFSNARGGTILIGIENGEAEPPNGQVIPRELLEKISKRMGELTVNVTVDPYAEEDPSRSRVYRIANTTFPGSGFNYQRSLLFAGFGRLQTASG